MNNDIETQRPRLTERQRSALLAGLNGPLRKVSRSYIAMEVAENAFDETVLRALAIKGLVEEGRPERLVNPVAGEYLPAPRDFERRWFLTEYGKLEAQRYRVVGYKPAEVSLTRARAEALHAACDPRGVEPHPRTSIPEQGIFTARTLSYLAGVGLVTLDTETMRYHATDEGRKAAKL